MAKNLNINPDTVAKNRPETKDKMQGGGAGKASTKASSSGRTVVSTQKVKWQVPTLAHNFNLSAAEEVAYKRAASYMNNVLERDDMQISLERKEEGWVGHVSDLNTGGEVSRYKGQDVLKLYAQNIKERGIIVDGRV